MARQHKILLLILLIFLGLAGLGYQALSRWDWGGPILLSSVQEKINGKITAGKISGNPFTGITYQDLVIEGSTGKVFLKTARLELRVSLQSIAAGHLILGNLALAAPHLHVEQAAGHWDIEELLKAETPPAEAPGIIGRITASFLQEVDLTKVLIDQGEILMIRDGAPTRYRDLTLKSNLTIANLGRPEQEIKVKEGDLGVSTPQGQVQFESRLAYRAGVAKVDLFELKLAGETILSLQGELCPPATGVACQATGQLGPLKGARMQQLWDRWPAAWDLSGKFTYRGTPQGAHLEVAGGIGQAKFDLQGQLDTEAKPGGFDLHGTLQGLTTEQLKGIREFKEETIQGLSPVNARLRLKGAGLPWEPESMEGDLILEPFRYKEVKVSQLQLILKGTAQNQHFQGLIEGNFGRVNTQARGRLLPFGEGAKGLQGDLTLRTERFQPAMVGLPGSAGTELNSSFSGRFRLPPGYAASQLYLAGDLSAHGRLGQEPLKSLRARFVLDGEKLDIARAEMKLAAGEASVRGMISREGVDLTFSAAIAGSRNLPVQQGATFFSLQANGTIRGAWKSPRINLAAQANQLSYQGTTLQSAGLKAGLAGWPPQSGDLVLQGINLHTGAGDFSRFDLNARGQAGIWGFRLAATSPKYPRLELAGGADFSARPLGLRIDKVAWQSQGLTIKNKTPFQVHFLPGWEISPAAFQVDGGTVSVQGGARGNELTGRVEVQDLNADLLQPAGFPATGKLSGRLTLAGTPQAPLINGNFALASGQIQEVKISSLTTTFSYSPDQLQLSGFLGGPQHSRLTWKGSVPVRLSVIPFRFVLGNQGLDLRVQSEKIDLSLVPVFTPEIQSAAGPVDMLITAKGDPRQPQVTGYIRWGAGVVQLRQAGLPYKLVPGEMRLQGDKVEIPAITMESQGTLNLSGNVNLKGSTRIETRLQGFQLMNRGGNEIWLDGAINLSGPMSRLVATGQVTVPKALLRPTLFSSGLDPDIVIEGSKPPSKKASRKPNPYQNMQIDVAIDSRGNVRVKDPKGTVELAIALKATKKRGRDLAMGGAIRALKGTLTIENRPFKVERAIITMPGVPDRPVMVDVKANHKMDDHDITLVLLVKGPTSNPQVTLESIPPLPPADTLSYLVFGAPAATLTKEQYLTLGVQGLGGLTDQKVGEVLGTALPFISKSGGSAMLRKQIIKNVSVTYGRKLNETTGQYESQAGIEYKINRHLSIDSQIAPRNSGADVLFNYEW